MTAAVTFIDGTTAGVATLEMEPNSAVKMIKTFVPTSFVWGTDSLQIDLTRYGMTTLIGFFSFEETTAGSVVVARAGTTSVSAAGVLTWVSTGSAAKGGSLLVIGV